MTHIEASEMSYDEFTYEVDCLLIGQTGEPASQEQLRAIAAHYDKGRTPWECFSTITAYLEEAA